MPDFRYTGTLRIESNDPATPREIELQALQSSFIAPVTFASYEGAVEIHGITELANVSDPPRKYQNLIPNEGIFARQETDPGPADLSPIVYYIRNRTAVNDADVKYQQMSIDANQGSKGTNFGFPGYTVIPAGTPWWMARLATGGNLIDSMELVPAPGLAPYGWDESVPNWFKLPFEKDKRFKRLVAPDGFDRDAVEFATSPNIHYVSRSIGSTTSSIARFNIRLTAERGNAGYWNIYIFWGMGQPPVGFGQLARVWLQARQGDQPVVADTNGALMGSIVAGFGSGVVYLYRRFRLPDDCSFRFFGSVVGSPANEYQFPLDWASEEARITDDILLEMDHRTWFYLDPNKPIGAQLRDQTYTEVLVNEDPVPEALIADGGTLVATDQWAKTVGISGGVAPESYDPISFEGRTIKATFTMFGLTPLQVYTVGLTYEQVQTGSTVRTYLQDSIDVYPGLDTFANVEIDIIAPLGFQRRLYATSITGVAPEPEAGDGVDRVFQLLAQGSAAEAGATYTPTEQAAIDAFIAELSTKAYKNNLKYVLPFFGNDIVTQIQPIWDINFYGPPTNNNFVDADGSTATGLRGNGTTKYLTMPFRHSFLQSLSASGEGVFFNQCDWGGDGGQWIGANWESGNTQVFGLRIGDYRALFYHGTTTFPAGDQVTPVTNANYFGIAKSDTDRKLYRNGVLIGSDTNAVSSTGAGANSIVLFADTLSGIRENASSLFCAYYTDGSGIWTDANVLDLHNLIQTHLINAVGRSVSTKSPDLATFETRVARNTGTLAPSSITLATNFLNDLRGFSAYHKLRLISGFLGSDLNALLTPVYDPVLSGPIANTGFTLADITEATGVQGAGLVPGGKYLTPPRNAGELGASNNGGIGWREMDLDFGNTSSNAPIGYNHSVSAYAFWLRLAAAQEQFSYGLTANAASTANVPTNSHYYGQRSSATSRELFKDAVSIASNVTSDPATGSTARDFNAVAGHDVAAGVNYFWAGRCGIFYFTTGDLTAGEITDLHTIIEDFITATGR